MVIVFWAGVLPMQAVTPSRRQSLYDSAYPQSTHNETVQALSEQIFSLRVHVKCIEVSKKCQRAYY